MDLSSDFWNNRYESGETGWDLGGVSSPLKSYFDQLTDGNLKILIPGAGNAYEAEYQYNLGFKDVHIADFSPKACQQFGERIPSFPKSNIHCADFFELEGTYDLIIEQTFFCALDPSLRADYALKMSSLLKSKGKLVGVMFDDEMNTDHPPFGGCQEEYMELFSPYFDVELMQSCKNSIKPRTGREIFVKLVKP